MANNMGSFKQITNKYLAILKKTFSSFGDDNATKLSGSLAYGTIFSLPPLLLLLIIIGGAAFGADAFSGKIFFQLKDILGEETALQIQDVIKGLNTQSNSFLAGVISSVALILAATGIFTEIQSSLNFIWGVKAKPKKGIIKLVLNRLLSVSMILGLGFLLVVSLVANTVLVALSREILSYFPALPMNMIHLISYVFVFFVLSFLFSAIFKLMPDVKIRWGQIWPGAFVTSVLFLLGKFAINLYIANNNTISLYGAASTVIILLVWIYFSSLIFYFGAEFTKAYIEYHGRFIEPTSYAEYSDRRLWRQHIAMQQARAEQEKKLEGLGDDQQ